jgi:ribonuclease HI
MSNCRKNVIIYTDGAADPNPGPGGYGVVLIYGDRRRELCGGFRRTTNNRMEIYAAIHGLQTLKEACDVTLYSDSKYLVQAMSDSWVERWRAKNWRRGQKDVINADLWRQLWELCQTHRVTFTWVKGHAGNTENERCDALSVQLLKNKDLPADLGYEEKPEQEEIFGNLASSAKQPRPKLAEGGPCRVCSVPLIRRTPRDKKPKPGQTYYYEYYLYCPGCKRMFMVEEGKRQCPSVLGM